MKFYDVNRLEDSLKRYRDSGEGNLVKYVERDVRAFSGNAEQADDITMRALSIEDKTVLSLNVDIQDFVKIKNAILESVMPKELKLNMCVAAEEIFVNICTYAFDGKCPMAEKILFVLNVGDEITITFEDGGFPYDPTKNVISVEEYDANHQIGGLGKLIVFNIADRVEYEYNKEREKSYDNYKRINRWRTYI